MKNPSIQTVFVTGGAGYVGSVLIPLLLDAGYRVRVLDLFIYGEHVFDDVPEADRDRLEILKGDLRDQALLRKGLAGCDAVIHLACISNDPSFELDPAMGRSINFDAFMPLVDIAKDSGVRRFIYASSSSVYGVKEDPNVTEDLPLEPLTDYSKFKAMCEDELRKRVQVERDRDLRYHLDCVSLHLGRLKNPMPDGLQGRRGQQRMPADQTDVFDVPVGADQNVDLDDALNMAIRRVRRIRGWHLVQNLRLRHGAHPQQLHVLGMRRIRGERTLDLAHHEGDRGKWRAQLMGGGGGETVKL